MEALRVPHPSEQPLTADAVRIFERRGEELGREQRERWQLIKVIGAVLVHERVRSSDGGAHILLGDTVLRKGGSLRDELRRSRSSVRPKTAKSPCLPTRARSPGRICATLK